MRGGRRSIAFFIVLGTCLVALAVALNVGWILLNWREVTLLVLGIIFFVAIIAGLILNTAFLVREIRRSEQHDSFINAVTHELKTPITSIRLYLETLQTREVDEGRRREFYSIMLADTDRLLHTVEQVLRAGRARDRRRLNARVIDLGEVVRECVDLTRTRYHLPPETIRYSESLNGDGRPAVLGDPDELRAAVVNLLDNAVKYSDKEIDIAVDVSIVEGRSVRVRVRDRGIGIPANQIRHVFKRFYRVPPSVVMRVKGTGLGLFIVRSIAEKYGGRALAESPGIGQGSTFSIQLPRAQPQ
ncbi:MAG: HAMP domain-containing histidine kinase [Acidobacteria bacterium]|nr:HAMP domain-containing histidine kinase [Acidobacteriota bacterium]